jgi:excisionase family DNA binding protein
MTEKILTTSEVAERLGMTRRYIRTLITNGVLPAEKLGRDYVIKESDLTALEDRPKRGRPTKKPAKNK